MCQIRWIRKWILSHFSLIFNKKSLFERSLNRSPIFEPESYDILFIHLIIKCLMLLKKFYATLKCVDSFRITVNLTECKTCDLHCVKPPRKSQVHGHFQVRYTWPTAVLPFGSSVEITNKSLSTLFWINQEHCRQ